MRKFSIFFITAVYFFLLNPAFAKDTGHVRELTGERVEVKECGEDYKGLHSPSEVFGSMGEWSDFLLGRKDSSRLQPEKTRKKRQP